MEGSGEEEIAIFAEKAEETCSDRGKEISCPCRRKEKASGHNEEGGFGSGEVGTD